MLPAAATIFLLSAVATSGSAQLPAVQLQRFTMGTMIEIVAYHAPRAEAEQALTRAMDEISRLDRVMSHYRPDSDLARLVRAARVGFTQADPALFDVIGESMRFSRLSRGKFDVTVAPLVSLWRSAAAEGRRPSDAEIGRARRCVGYELIELQAPDRIRFRSDCLDIDLGGIGKGYALDRAAAMLKDAGIRHALINAGGSSIVALGHPPGREGWPVLLRAPVHGRSVLLLRDGSISTSQQYRVPLAQSPGSFGEIVDPATAAPADGLLTVSVAAPRAVVSDALDTALVMLPVNDGLRLLAEVPDVSALWMTPAGGLKAAYRDSILQLAARHH